MNENRLIDLREKDDLKAVDIAKNLNVAKATYSLWENNKSPIPTKRIIELANYYKVNIDYLLKLTNKRIDIFDKETKVDLKDIAIKLIEIRSNLGLSLRQLSEKIDYSYSAIYRYEKGICLIKSEPLITLCKMTNYSIDWVLGRSDEKYIK